MDMLEIRNKYKIRKLTADKRVESFDCGDADLNDFILFESLLYGKAMLVVNYVLEHKETKTIAAYFSLANDRVSLSDFQSKTEFNRFRKKRFVNEKRLKSYFVANNKAGCRFLTVDAYRGALKFYEKNGFVAMNSDDENSDTRLLYFDLNDIADSPA